LANACTAKRGPVLAQLAQTAAVILKATQTQSTGSGEVKENGQ
jgi:hypothetical protein